MQNTSQRVFSNTISVLAQRMAGNILGFVLSIYIARKMGAVDFGALNVSRSFVALFAVFADIGLTTLTIREVARLQAGAEDYIGKMTVLKILLSFLFLIFVFISSYFYNSDSALRTLVFLISLSFMLENLGSFFSAVFQAREKMGFMLYSTFVEKFFLLALCFIFISNGFGLLGIGIAYALSGLMYFIVNVYVVYSKFVVPRYQIDIPFWKKALQQGLPLAFAAVVSMIYFNIDIIMLGKMKDQQTAGWYSVSYQIFFTVATLSGAFLTAVFPVMSRHFQNSKDSLIDTYHKSFKLIFAAGLPLSVGGIILARSIILFFYGPRYENSVIPFSIFSSVFVFAYLNGLASYFLTAINRQLSVAKMLAVTAVINVIFNLILIPRFSGAGAACATVISECTFFLMFYFSLPTELRYLPAGNMIKSAFAAIAMSIVILFLKSFNLIAVVSIGMIIYFVMIWFLRYFDREDILIFKGMFTRGEQ